MEVLEEILDARLGNSIRLDRQTRRRTKAARYVRGTSEILDEDIVQMLIGHGLCKVLVYHARDGSWNH